MGNYNDGALRYGTRRIDVFAPQGSGPLTQTTWPSPKKGTYVLENATVNRTAHEIDQYTELRSPFGSVAVEDFVRGSAVAQWSNQPSLQVGDGFNVAFETDNTNAIINESFVITGVDGAETQGEYFKQNIRFKKLYQGSVPASTSLAQ